MTVLPAIETNEPDEGAPDPDASMGEWTAWNMRRRLPSEHVHRPALRWPQAVEDLTNIPVPTLKKLRAQGDHPRLFAIGRAMFTTHEALIAWFEAHELAPGQLMRPATIARGSKLPPDAEQRRLRGPRPKKGAAPIAPIAPVALPGRPKKSKEPARPRAVEAAEQAA